MPAENFYIALYDPATELVSFPYFVDKYDPPPQPRKTGKGITEYVLRSRKPLLATPQIILEMLQKGDLEDIRAESIGLAGRSADSKGRNHWCPGRAKLQRGLPLSQRRQRNPRVCFYKGRHGH